MVTVFRQIARWWSRGASGWEPERMPLASRSGRVWMRLGWAIRGRAGKLAVATAPGLEGTVRGVAILERALWAAVLTFSSE